MNNINSINITNHKKPTQAAVIKKLKRLFIERWLITPPIILIIALFISNEITYAQNYTKPIDFEPFVWTMAALVAIMAIYSARYLHMRETDNLGHLLEKDLVTAILISSTGALLAYLTFLIMPSGGSLSIAMDSVNRLLLAGLLTVLSLILFIVHCFSISATRRNILNHTSTN